MGVSARTQGFPVRVPSLQFYFPKMRAGMYGCVQVGRCDDNVQLGVMGRYLGRMCEDKAGCVAKVGFVCG